MQIIKLNDDIYSTFIVYTSSEWEKEAYKSHDIYDKTIRVNLIASERGTTLIFENKHFLVVPDNAILKNMQFGAIIKLLDIANSMKRPPKRLIRQIILFFGLDSTKQRTRKNIKRCKYMRYCGRQKNGKALLLTDNEIINNALEQEKSGIKPHYAFYDYKNHEKVTPAGWLVWSLSDGGCGVVYRRKDGKMIVTTGLQGDFCYC